MSTTCLPSSTLSCSCEIFCFEPSRRLSFNFVLRTGTLDNGCHNSDNDLVMKLQIRSVNTGRLRTAAGAKTNKSPISCSKNRLNEESSIPPLSRQWTPRQPVGRSMPHVWERNFLSSRTAGVLLRWGSTFISAHRIRRLVVVVMTPGNGAYTR